MKFSLPFKRCFRRSHVPTLSLIALLQRTPVVQVATSVEEFVLSSPIGTVLKSFSAIAASLGAMNSLAGATPLSPSTGADTGTSATVGTAVNIAFTVSPTQTPIKSWKVGGSIPDGTDFSGLTAPGGVDIGSLKWEGTPTKAGTFSVTLQAFSATGESGFQSATYTYTITVTGSSATAPTINTQPASQTVSVGANVTFTVDASGSPTPTYQWMKGGTNITGATSASLSLNNVQATDAGNYTVAVTNSAGSVTSSVATLTVNVPANAPATPASAGGFASSMTEVTLTWVPASTGGAPSSFKVERAADSAFGTSLTSFSTTGAVSSYVDTTASANTSYYYRVSSVNASGTSAPTSAIHVQTPASNGSGNSHIVNIATRAYCSTGDAVTIGGFVVGGSVPKQVLVRAVGPTLTASGIAAADVLADPVVEVHHGASVIATNDNWGDNANAAQITTVAHQIGATAFLDSDTKSAALLITLDPGVYSFIVSGSGGASGVVLLEVYDADTSNTASNFVNIATRAKSVAGTGVTIGGFVVSGSAPKNVLIRAVGPSLTKQGLSASTVLADPTLELHSGSPMIAVNDNWGDNANATEITSTGARIGATPLDSADSKSSALLVKLMPGAYTFIAGGNASGSGVVLVEVYDAD